ncbi:MAG: (Fe-S)-binding protein [Candidatus Helarchaeales archaeon]
MSTNSKLEKLRRWIYDCVKCSTCKWLDAKGGHLRSCPAGSKFRFESYYSSGKVWIARALLENQIEFTDSVIQKIYACPTCGNCQEICGMHVAEHLVEIFETLREAAVEAGKGPLPSQKAFKESVDVNRNPYGELHEQRMNWIDGFQPESKADLFYFVGCTASYRRNEIARSTTKLFDTLGLKIALNPEEWCCGSPLIRTGQTQNIKELIEHNLNVFRDAGAREVITACAGCYKTLNKDYPKILGKELDVKITHITDFLGNKVQEGNLKFEKETTETVTYHDPCHIGRHSGIYESPRKLIESIPGVKLIEMERNRERAWCCGAGGGVKSAFKDWAVEIAMERIEEAEKTGATKLITSCPFCKTNLLDAVNARNSSLTVYDITEYLLEKI